MQQLLSVLVLVVSSIVDESVDTGNLVEHCANSQGLQASLPEVVDTVIDVLFSLLSKWKFSSFGKALAWIPCDSATVSKQWIGWYIQLEHLEQVDGLVSRMLVTVLDVLNDV